MQAITCLKRAHYLNPLAVQAACNLGIVFLATGQPASAAIHLCAAVTADPKGYMPYTLLGSEYVNVGAAGWDAFRFALGKCFICIRYIHGNDVLLWKKGDFGEYDWGV